MVMVEDDERTVRCPLDGCDREVLARGINLHIRQSSDDIHGSQGEMPEGVTLDELQTVGTESVEVDYPENRQNTTKYVFCPFCHRVFKGKRGIQIHLSRQSGKGPHPNTEDQDVEEECLEKIDRMDGKPLLIDVMKQYIEHLVEEGDIDEARRAKKFLFDQYE